MTKLIARLAIPAALILLAGAASAAPRWVNEETLTFKNYGLYVEKAEGDEDSPRLTVAASYDVKGGDGGYALQITREGGLETLKVALAEQDGLPANGLTSAYLYAPGPVDPAGPRYFMVFGRAFASDPGGITVIHAGAKGATTLLSDDTFLLEAIADLDHDGLPELIGHRSLSQSFNDCMATYDPYTVYRQATPTGAFKAAPKLSRSYTLAQGYPWAGPKAREDIGVSHCGTHGLTLMKPPK